jgi:hypothetical protein
MKTITYSIFLCFCVMTMSFSDYTKSMNNKKHHTNIEQKVIYLLDYQSNDLNGSKSDKTKNEVLPAYLKEGWVVVKMTSGGTGAYILLERERVKWNNNIKPELPKITKTDIHRITISQYNDIKINEEKVNAHELIEKLKSFNATPKSTIILNINKQASYNIVNSIMEALKKGNFTNTIVNQK